MSTDTIRSAAPYLLSWARAQAAHLRVPGVQLAVRSGDELVLDEAIGVADLSTGEPLRTDHLFRIASHSKTFTGTAVMQLVEAGRLRLDDPAGTWVPELVSHASPIADATVRELLGHQAGVIRDGDHADFWQLEYPFPDRERLLAAVVADGGAVHPRNEHFKYSNLGYGLLGLVIEAVSGLDYATYLRRHVLDPLGLQRTGAELEPGRTGEYAAGHTGLLLGALERKVIEHVDTRALAPATGFYSTAAELTTYGSAHWFGDTRLIGDESKRLMQRLESVVTSYGTEIGRYGVGIERRTIGKRELVGHSGGYPGHITRTYIDPRDQLVVSVLTNAIDGPAEQIATGIIKLLDAALTPSSGTTPAPHDETLPPLSSYTGRFANLWGALDIADLGGRLVLVRPTLADPLQGLEETTVEGPDLLRVHAQSTFGAGGELVHLERGSDGAVASVRSTGMTSWPVEEFRRRLPGMTRTSVPGLAP